jgi:hypothetical protein
VEEEVPRGGGYMALELFVVSARTNKGIIIRREVFNLLPQEGGIKPPSSGRRFIQSKDEAGGGAPNEKVLDEDFICIEYYRETQNACG